MDVVRAVITGPDDTPYSLGCFVFDLYFPPTYPDIPPLIKFTTTGGGTIRYLELFSGDVKFSIVE